MLLALGLFVLVLVVNGSIMLGAIWMLGVLIRPIARWVAGDEAVDASALPEV